MKQTLSTALCVCLCLALVSLAVCIGAVRGWAGERERTLRAFSQGGEMFHQLDERAMDAANLAVVAARHLPKDDPSLTALQDARRVIISEHASMQDKADADAALCEAASRLARMLPELASVQASARDQAYISALTQTLAEASTLMADYTDCALSFQHRLSSSFTGRLAMALGVEPLPLQGGTD